MIVYYRRLIKHAGSFIICVPRVILNTWNVRRGHYVRFVFHEDHTVTLEHVKEDTPDETHLQSNLPLEDPTAPGAAPLVYGQ